MRQDSLNEGDKVTFEVEVEERPSARWFQWMDCPDCPMLSLRASKTQMKGMGQAQGFWDANC